MNYFLYFAGDRHLVSRALLASAHPSSAAHLKQGQARRRSPGMGAEARALPADHTRLPGGWPVSQPLEGQAGKVTPPGLLSF